MYLAEYSIEWASYQNGAKKAVFRYIIYYFAGSIVFQSVNNNP